jgi:hypothetical protein
LEYLGGYRELNEGSDNSGINETAYVVKLDRTLKAGYWNTFCVPFNMDKSKLGTSAEVKELTGAVKSGDHYTLTFTEETGNIEAGKPYMVKVTSNINNIELSNVDGIAVNTTAESSVTEVGVTFTGVYTSGKAPVGSFIISNSNFYLVDEADAVSLNAFRGYITVPSPEVKFLNFTFEDDEATAIESIQNSKFLDSLEPGRSFNERNKIQNEEEQVYDLTGRKIVNGKWLNGKSHGIYIVNGRKVLY